MEKVQLPAEVIEIGNSRLNKFKREVRHLRHFNIFIEHDQYRLQLHQHVDRCLKLLKQARRHNLRRNQPRHTKMLFRTLDAVKRQLLTIDEFFTDVDFGQDRIYDLAIQFVGWALSSLKSVRSFLLTKYQVHYVAQVERLKDVVRHQGEVTDNRFGSQPRYSEAVMAIASYSPSA